MPLAQSNNEREPFVVIVDDDDQTTFADAVADKGVAAVAVSPDDLNSEVLSRASLVVLDQYLEKFPTRDKLRLPVSLQVLDGLALAGVLRSHVERSGKSDTPEFPVAFALRTGDLDRVGVGLPKSARQHLLASQYNLEWVFDKRESSPDSARIADLATAAATLPVEWGSESRDPGLTWLQLPDSPWSDDARWQVEQCRPPQHVVADRTAGRAWLRWFMHRILPYPTFLLDRKRVALMLGTTTTGLNRLLATEGPIAEALINARYEGPLAEFQGEKWWRAGVSHLIAEIMEPDHGDLFESRAIAETIGAVLHIDFPALDLDLPVLTINSDYSIGDYPIDSSQAVRLHPDGWPPFADEAWADKDDVTAEDSDPDLLALVVSTDRWRLRSSVESDS